MSLDSICKCAPKQAIVLIAGEIDKGIMAKNLTPP